MDRLNLIEVTTSAGLT